jgi:CAAX protease family protein
MTTIAVAVFGGVAVLFAGSLPWGFVLAPANLRFARALPWAIVPMAAYLVMYWRFISGRGGSPATAAGRRHRLRAHPLTADVWAASIVAGLLGFAALFAFVAVMARLVTLAGSAPLTAPEGMPRATVFTLLVMSSIVAGVTEEAGFRGYMQGPIERRYGLAAGILINGTLFGLLHFPNHPADVLTMLPYYIAVAAVYGGLTWAANSILPAVVLHAGGDVWSLGRLWMTGKPEWQLSQAPAALVTGTGIDARFLLSLAVFVALTAVAVWAYRGVYRLRTQTAHNAASSNNSDRESVNVQGDTDGTNQSQL